MKHFTYVEKEKTFLMKKNWCWYCDIHWKNDATL